MDDDLRAAVLAADAQAVLFAKGVLYTLVDVAQPDTKPLGLDLAAFQLGQNILIDAGTVVLHDNVYAVRNYIGR